MWVMGKVNKSQVKVFIRLHCFLTSPKPPTVLMSHGAFVFLSQGPWMRSSRSEEGEVAGVHVCCVAQGGKGDRFVPAEDLEKRLQKKFGFWGPLSGIRLCFVDGGQIVGISPTPSGS